MQMQMRLLKEVRETKENSYGQRSIAMIERRIKLKKGKVAKVNGEEREGRTEVVGGERKAGK